MPVGKAEWVDGGVKLSGHWSFSSGCDHADWIFLGGFVPSEGGRPDMRTFLLPKSDYEIIDNWHVSGLKASGSKDVKVDAVISDLAKILIARRTKRGAIDLNLPESPRAVAYVQTVADVEGVKAQVEAMGLETIPPVEFMSREAGRPGMEFGIIDFDGHLILVYGLLRSTEAGED